MRWPSTSPVPSANPAGAIEFLAPVRGYELTTRAELLRDEPRASTRA